MRNSSINSLMNEVDVEIPEWEDYDLLIFCTLFFNSIQVLSIKLILSFKILVKLT